MRNVSDAMPPLKLTAGDLVQCTIAGRHWYGRVAVVMAQRDRVSVQFTPSGQPE